MKVPATITIIKKIYLELTPTGEVVGWTTKPSHYNNGDIGPGITLHSPSMYEDVVKYQGIGYGPEFTDDEIKSLSEAGAIVLSEEKVDLSFPWAEEE